MPATNIPESRNLTCVVNSINSLIIIYRPDDNLRLTCQKRVFFCIYFLKELSGNIDEFKLNNIQYIQIFCMYCKIML